MTSIKKQEILEELRKHKQKGVTVIEIASKVKTSSATANKWLRRLEAEDLAESWHYGCTLVFYPVLTREGVIAE